MSELNPSTYNTYKAALTAIVLASAFAAPMIKAQDNYGPQQPYGQQGYDEGNPNQVDPPSRVARVSVTAGNVSIEPASVNQFTVAEPNYPMTTGDRIYADLGSNAEIQTGQLAVRLGSGTDLTVTAMTDTLAQFGIATGGVHLRSYNIFNGETVEIDTPNVAVTVMQAGDIRVDVNPANDSTTVYVVSGQVEVYGNGFQQVIVPGQRVRLNGSNPVYAEQITAPARGFGGFVAQLTGPQDPLDRFSFDRDRLYEAAYAANGQYVNPGTIGAEDLNTYGSWQSDPDNGPVWYPSNVSYDWQPYRNGHWTWVAPWGWTWIEAEPWGFAPFHYGRWNRFGNRWGWIPGPTVVRPIYSPALVVFVGGNNFSGGVTGWFPLGPREVYQPWYHTSPQYINRVNVSNIYDRNTVNVRNVYNQRTVVNNYVNVDNRNFANRQGATVAMRQDNFARGGRADQSQVRLDQRQLAGAPVLPHPMITPERSMVAPAPARVVPEMQQRPTLSSHEDNRFGGGSDNRMRNGGTFQQPGNQPGFQQGGQQQNGQQNGQFRGQPGNPQNGQQGNPQNNQQNGQFNNQQNNGRGQQSNQQNGQQNGQFNNQQNNNQNQQRGQQGGQFNNGQQQNNQPGQGNRQQPTQPQQPVQAQQPTQPQQNIPQRQQPQQPVQTAAPTPPQRVQPQQPVQTAAPATPTHTTPQQVQEQPTQQQPPRRFDPQSGQQPGRVTAPVQQAPVQAQQPQQQQRPLVNRAVPPEPRPSFDAQRQAIQQNDPGRPLGPQQLQNLRQNQPAGQPQQREQPHPQGTVTPAPRGGPVKPIDPNKN